jgi:transposase
METTLVMSMKERVRLEAFSRVKRGEISVGKAAGLVGLSLRQARRMWRRYQVHGDAGLVHRLRGRPGNAGRAKLREKVLAVCLTKYSDFGSALAAEYLGKSGLEVCRQSLWRWRRQAGQLGAIRRSARHRIRRQRRSCGGELVQMDGSTHDWFEGRRGNCVLFVLVDDASGRLFCRFYESEDTSSAFDIFGQYVRKRGLPAALYVDKDSIYRVNDPMAREQGRQRGKLPQTQFGRAMGQLGVELIFANSPQAKGRVERANGILQDRLVKSLRLAGISSLEQANEFLERQFLPEHNRKFGQVAAGQADVHRKLSPGTILAEVLCVQETRTVGRDWCVVYGQQVLQLDKRHEKLALAGRKVTVLALANGQLRLLYRGHRLRWKLFEAGPLPAKASPQPTAPAQPTVAQASQPPQPWRPAASHPWRGSFARAAPLREASLRSASLRCAALAKLAG